MGWTVSIWRSEFIMQVVLYFSFSPYFFIKHTIMQSQIV